MSNKVSLGGVKLRPNLRAEIKFSLLKNMNRMDQPGGGFFCFCCFCASVCVFVSFLSGT